MDIFSLIKGREQEFSALCKRHSVKEVFAFGSSITNRFNAESDVDLMVDLNLKDPIEYGEALIRLWDELEIFFSRKIDLLTDDSIHNPYLRKSIYSTRKLIYEGQGEKIPIESSALF